MKISKVMLASVFLTAALLAVISGVVTKVLADRSAAAAAAAAPAAQDTQQATQLESQYQQREAQYQQLVAQANQQIEQANAELKQLQGQVVELKKNANPAAQAPVSAAVSADKAAQVAQDAAAPGQVLLKKVELVSFQGKTAFEAVFEKGSVYVDAQTGEVLFNGTVPQVISLARAAQVAAEYLKNTDILQTDKIIFRNAPMYRVIFKDGTMVYMDTTGQITYIQKAGPQVIVQQSASSGSGGQVAARPAEHEDGD